MAARLSDTRGKTIHACEGHKNPKVAKQQFLIKQAAGHVPWESLAPEGHLETRSKCHQSNLSRKKGIYFQPKNFCRKISK